MKFYPGGKNLGLMHVVAEGDGVKVYTFCPRKAANPGNAHTDNMQESAFRNSIFRHT